VLLRAVPLLAIALSAPLCGGEDPVVVLEREKQKLLENTVEKREFWVQVERKGVFAKEKRRLQDELSTLEVEIQTVEARRAGTEPGLANAREVNARAEEVRAEVEKREAELAAVVAELEGTLARWKDAGPPEGRP
jgi:septal ring factor EnvC (AmiA/AmiB activator)